MKDEEASIVLPWGEMLDRFGDNLSKAGFNEYAVAEGLATRSDNAIVTRSRALKLGMSNYEFDARCFGIN